MACSTIRYILQTLDWVYYLGLAPPRFAQLSGLTQYFAMARGTDEIQLALDMSKYFDTNYRESAFQTDCLPMLLECRSIRAVRRCAHGKGLMLDMSQVLRHQSREHRGNALVL